MIHNNYERTGTKFKGIADSFVSNERGEEHSQNYLGAVIVTSSFVAEMEQITRKLNLAFVNIFTRPLSSARTFQMSVQRMSLLEITAFQAKANWVGYLISSLIMICCIAACCYFGCK